MLRRDMFKVAGAGVAGFLLPQKSKAKGDVVVPTPEVVVNGRRVRVIRYDGSFLDGEHLCFWIDGRVDHQVHASARCLKATIKMVAGYHPVLSCVIVMDRNGHCMWFNLPKDAGRIDVTSSWHPSCFATVGRIFSPKVL